VLEKLYYQDKGLFLQSFHPATVLLYLLVLLVLSLLYDHPLYLLCLLFLLACLIKGTEGMAIWEGFLKIGLMMMLVLMVVNPLVIRSGATIIWQGPVVPLLGRLDISLEAIYFGLVSGLRLLVILSIFCLYNLMVNPDQALNLFARAAGKSALMVALATRMFPTMVRDLRRIKEVMELRGVDFDQGSLGQRVKKYAGLYNVLLFSSLEGSLEIAESMQARAYGSGKRTIYSRHLLRPRDYLTLGGSLLALSAAVWGLAHGCGGFNFYPEMDGLITGKGTMAVLVIVFFYLYVPLMLGGGYKYCRYIKSKI